MKDTLCNDTPDEYTPPKREKDAGISEGTAVISRGLAFALPAYFLGRMTSKLFITKRGLKVGTVPHITGLSFAGITGIMGAYGASREARAGTRQFDRLQDNIAKLHRQNYDLRTELKAQLCGEGTITEYKDEWDNPQPTVEAEGSEQSKIAEKEKGNERG